EEKWSFTQTDSFQFRKHLENSIINVKVMLKHQEVSENKLSDDEHIDPTPFVRRELMDNLDMVQKYLSRELTRRQQMTAFGSALFLTLYMVPLYVLPIF